MKMIMIGALWCPSCIIMRPRYRKIAEKKGFVFLEYDYDDDRETIGVYGIGTVLPVCILFDGNREVKRITGEKSVKELEKIFS